MSSWSGLRKQIKSFLVPQLRDQIDVHYTMYLSGSHYVDRQEEKNWRLWVTLNSREVFSTDFWAFRRHPEIQRREQTGEQLYLYQAVELGARNVDHYMEALRTYLRTPVSEARTAELLLIRALYWVDRRIGKRTLLRDKPGDDEHELVKTFL